MRKLLLMSVLIATFAIPMVYAGRSKPRRTLPKMQKAFAVFCLVYVLAIVYVMPYL